MDHASDVSEEIVVRDLTPKRQENMKNTQRKTNGKHGEQKENTETKKKTNKNQICEIHQRHARFRALNDTHDRSALSQTKMVASCHYHWEHEDKLGTDAKEQQTEQNGIENNRKCKYSALTPTLSLDFTFPACKSIHDTQGLN